jgi:hypothetical protein
MLARIQGTKDLAIGRLLQPSFDFVGQLLRFIDGPLREQTGMNHGEGGLAIEKVLVP